MVVGAVGDNLVALFNELFAHCGGVFHHLLLVLLVLGLGGFVESHGLCGNDVLKRAALDTGEYGRIEDGAHHLHLSLRSGEAPRVGEVLAHEDDASAGPAKGLMGGGSYYVSVFYGVLEKTCGNETGGVGHVNPEDGAHFVGNLSHSLIVPFAGVGRCSADDELGLALKGLALHFVVVYAAGFRVEAVCHGVIEDTAGVYGAAVGEVAAHGKVKTHEGVSGLEDGHGHCHVGLCARMGLDVCVFGVVEGLEPVNCKLLNLVHYLAAAVVALAGVAFGVFICAHGAHGGHYLIRYVVFRCNKFQASALALLFLLDKIKKLNVFFHRVIGYYIMQI